jgi:hypothetical protein
MTKSSAARIDRRMGRPPKDDQLTIDVAAALRVAYRLGPQGARDLAAALIEGHEVGESRRPRAGRPADWVLTGFRLPSATFKARSEYLKDVAQNAHGAKRAKLKHTPPRSEVTAALILALRAKDDGHVRQCIRQLALLGTISRPKLARAVGQLTTPQKK